MSQRLRSALLRTNLDAAGLAAAVGVDAKTVTRWLSGRIPRQRTRLAVADVEVRQEFNVTYLGRVVGGTLTISDESTEVRFVGPADLAHLPIHDSVRLRLRHHAEHRDHPYLG